MKYKSKQVLSFVVLISMFLSGIGPVEAAEFNNGFIISDEDLTDARAMSVADIQQFLARKSGTLSTYVATDMDGVARTASQILAGAAERYNINPKFLLVMLQKEQSLVEDSTPQPKQLDWAMGYGVCDDCSYDDAAAAGHKGFANQVDSAAGSQRWFIDNANQNWLKRAGQTYVIDNQLVFIANQATANLYNYTPHLAGNYNFWKIWTDWFNQSYPDGTLLQVKGDPGIWLIQNSERRPFFTKSALVSRYELRNVINVSKSDLENYPIGAPIKFPNYSVLIDPNKQVYLLVDDALRPFASNNVLRDLGFNPEEFENISLEELSDYQIGESLTLDSAYPSGALLQNSKTGGVYFVRDSVKFPIPTKDILTINFSNYKISKALPEKLDQFTTGDSVRLRDGILVKAVDDPAVYTVSKGERWPIASGEVFEKLGYNWQNIRVVDAKSLLNLPIGETVQLDFQKE